MNELLAAVEARWRERASMRAFRPDPIERGVLVEMFAAATLGIDTCPMASVAAYPEPLRAHLPIAETDVVLFGVALGYADSSAPANRTRTTREPVEANVTFVG
jgi:nitroreductase